MEDRCPGVLRLHAAADGHLLRIRLPGGRLSLPALEGIADLAEIGNGLIELTSRASLQVRGLGAGDADRAAQRLSSAGLLPSPAHDRVRNVLASPLGGRVAGALAATDPLVAAIDAGLCDDPALAALPGRFLFAVEDGSGIAGGRQGDVTLAAEAGEPGRVRLRLHLKGMPTTRTAAPDAAAGLALEAARAFLAVSPTVPATDGGPVWRIADLPAAALDRLLERLETRFTPGPRLGTGRQITLGPLRLVDGSHAVTALAPLGRLHADGARGLAALTAASGGQVGVSPWRTVSVVDVPGSCVEMVVDGLTGLGLVLDEASGWRGLSACAGIGACANARIDVRGAAAARAAGRAAARGENGIPGVEHWSACERRCGTPPAPAHAVTATSAGIEVRGVAGTCQVDTVEAALASLAAGGLRP